MEAVNGFLSRNVSYTALQEGEESHDCSESPREACGSPMRNFKGLYTSAGLGGSRISTRSHSPVGAAAAAEGLADESVAAEAMGETSVRTAISNSDDEKGTEAWETPIGAPQPRKLFSFEAALDACTRARKTAPQHAMRLLSALAAAAKELPQTCRDTWENVHGSFVHGAAAAGETLGLERFVLCMHISVASLSLLFCSLSSLLLGVAPRVSYLRLLFGGPLLGGPLGLCTWSIARLHAKASQRLYWPLECVAFRPSVGLRLLQLLLHCCFSAASLCCWVATLLLLGGLFSLPALSCAVPVVCLCRLAFRALLQLLSVALSPQTVDFGVPKTEHAALWRRLARCSRADYWVACVEALPDFYGPTDVSRRPKPWDLAFYLGAPLRREGEETFLEGPPGSPPSSATERLLPSAHAAGAAAAATADDEDLMQPLEAAAEECAAFLGLPGGGPSLTRSCYVLGALAEGAAFFLYMCIDGSLAFLSLGGFTLLCGERLAAGLLLSRAPLFAATCALSASVLSAAKQIAFSLLLTAECDGAHLGGAPVPFGLHLAEGAAQQGGAPSAWKRLQQALAGADPLALFRVGSSSSSSTEEKQQLLLQRLTTGDIEGGTVNRELQQPLQQEQVLLQEQQHVLGPVEPVQAISVSSSSNSKPQQDREPCGDMDSDSEGEDMDEGSQTL